MYIGGIFLAEDFGVASGCKYALCVLHPLG